MAILDLASFQTLVDRRYREIKDFELASVTDQLPLWFGMEVQCSGNAH